MQHVIVAHVPYYNYVEKLCRQIFERTQELHYISCCMDLIAEQNTLKVVECMSDTQYEG